MRLFIAINFNEDTRKQLVIMRDELRSHAKRGNFSLAENLHLTLAFLGECDVMQAAAAKSAMQAVSFKPFPFKIERAGRFRRNGSDLWWAGAQASEPLLAMHGDLTDKLIAAGFTPEKRKFSPHITLGREIVTDAAPWTVEPFGETVVKIELMKSERINGKLTYSAI